MSNRYAYEELRTAAIRPGATQEEINTLGEWFEQYGLEYWNGEYFDADGYRVYRIERHDPERDIYDIIGYEIQ